MKEEKSEQTLVLEELLKDFLQEGEVPEYDPKEVKVYALNEGVRRELELPDMVKRKVLKEVRQPLYD
jgi:hypothetical protein